MQHKFISGALISLTWNQLEGFKGKAKWKANYINNITQTWNDIILTDVNEQILTEIETENFLVIRFFCAKK